MALEILKTCMERGFLLDKEILNVLNGFRDSEVYNIISLIEKIVINEKIITKNILKKHIKSINNYLKDSPKEIGLFFEKLNLTPKLEENNSGRVKIISFPIFPQKKVEVKDFINHFRNRYEAIKSILEKRGFENLSSLRKIGERGSYTIIVSVFGKRITKNKNIILEVEDMTGNSTVLVNQNKKEVFQKAKDLLLDDIVAIEVSGSNEILFANDIFYPDSFLEEKKHGKLDEFVAFVSDFHVGSTMFLEKNLLRFIKWLNGEEGDEEQKELAKKVKYLFIIGDNVDGVNHYPGQEKYLNLKSSTEQYGKLEEILKLIRPGIKIIICPGQHDAVWVGEPQPIISERWAPGLHKMENVYLVPNPALVEIDCGFKILMYHGASISQFIDEISEIRVKYGHTSPTTVVKEMLKRRHIAPMHGLVDYIPCEKKDPMVIDIVPDIFVTGDQHRAEVSQYNNILLIASSCWQSQTPFEEKVGNIPDPCKVPLFNLKTREIKILDFSDDLNEKQKKNVK